jgi:dTDP-4-amino-4,6-dideoxygalactose transaminase
MRSIDEAVIDSVMSTLKQQRLFRYDCEQPEDSPTARLEQRVCELLGVKYCIAMNSCSSALFTSLLGCGVKPGDHVLIPAFTFIAVPSAVIHAGAVPVLVEVTEDYVIDLVDLERKITPATKVLLLSYMRGRVPDLDAVAHLCQRHGVTLVEDAAHSLGVMWDGRPTGSFGRAAAFSAQSHKMIDGGEGGLLVTNDRDIAFQAMLYAGCYEQNWRKHFGIGIDGQQIDEMINTLPAYNFRMSNLSAAALLPQIEQVDARVARYNGNYWRMTETLRRSPYVRLPRFAAKVRPAADSLQFCLEGLDDIAVTKFVEAARERGVKLSVFGLDEKNARCFWHWRFIPSQSCPRTKALLERTVDMRLPLHLESADIDRIGAAILDALDVAIESSGRSRGSRRGVAWSSKKNLAIG